MRSNPALPRGAFALLLAACVGGTASAQESAGTSGAWVFGIEDEVAAASTTNADGTTYGMICAGNCINYIVADRPCREGAEYPATVRSTIGEQPISMTCRQVEGRYVLTSAPDQNFVRMTSESSEVEIAVRTGDGQTQTFRFSLEGAYAAVYMTLAAAMLFEEPGQAAEATPQ